MNTVCRVGDSCIKRTFLTKSFDTLHHVLGVKYSRNADSLDIESVSAVDETEYLEREVEVNEQEILLKRDKSRLNPQHRNRVHGRVPFSEPMVWVHETIKYKRKMYGLYGNDSGVNPAIAWPSRQEIEDIREYESVAYPETLQEMVRKFEQAKAEKERIVKEREQEIMRKMAKLEQWKKEVNDKMRKKEADALAAKAKKERIIEEVRQMFGYKADPRDDKFKEMLEKKEKEEKKLAKEARKKEKADKALARMLAQGMKAAEAKPE